MAIDDDDDSSELKKKLPVAQSLKVTAKDISDYYTKAEYTSFMKPKAGKEKKMRRVRKKEEEVDPLEGVEDFPTGTEGEQTCYSLSPLLLFLFYFSFSA